MNNSGFVPHQKRGRANMKNMVKTTPAAATALKRVWSDGELTYYLKEDPKDSNAYLVV